MTIRSPAYPPGRLDAGCGKRCEYNSSGQQDAGRSHLTYVLETFVSVFVWAAASRFNSPCCPRTEVSPSAAAGRKALFDFPFSTGILPPPRGMLLVRRRRSDLGRD